MLRCVYVHGVHTIVLDTHVGVQPCKVVRMDRISLNLYRKLVCVCCNLQLDVQDTTGALPIYLTCNHGT
jgi:hypothetical protein